MVMNSNEQALTAFQTRVRQMLLRFQQLKKENDELYTMLEQNEKDIEDLRKKLEQKKNDYDSLKMAKMIEISGGDIEDAKSKLSKLIRDVNKCIAILKEQKTD